jgi:DNA-binding transcriptional LysR family regulator
MKDSFHEMKSRKLEENYMNPYELEQLVAFSELGTLAAVAEKMNISQPTITRSMQHLEDDFGVPLFERKINRIELTDTGKKAVEYARIILSDIQTAKSAVKEHYLSTRTIRIASCAPYPLWQVMPKLSAAFPNMTLSSVIRDNDFIENAIENEEFDLYIATNKTQKPDYLSKPYMSEQLFVCVTTDHDLARFDKLTFSEINGHNFILRSELGFWDKLCRQKMPSSKFLVQLDSDAFEELRIKSTLPYFVTDVSIKDNATPQGRKIIPLTDDEAFVIYYLICHKDKPQLLRNY